MTPNERLSNIVALLRVDPLRGPPESLTGAA